LEVERERIIELRLLNLRETAMALSIRSKGVERLPELAPHGEVGSRDSVPFVFRRFRRGRCRQRWHGSTGRVKYEARVYVPGVFFIPETFKITVK
jgi:hypothetical protein